MRKYIRLNHIRLVFIAETGNPRVKLFSLNVVPAAEAFSTYPIVSSRGWWPTPSASSWSIQDRSSCYRLAVSSKIWYLFTAWHGQMYNILTTESQSFKITFTLFVFVQSRTQLWKKNMKTFGKLKISIRPLQLQNLIFFLIYMLLKIDKVMLIHLSLWFSNNVFELNRQALAMLLWKVGRNGLSKKADEDTSLKQSTATRLTFK